MITPPAHRSISVHDHRRSTLASIAHRCSWPPSGLQRLLRGEFKFPLFSATPQVSAQIISSAAAAPMEVDAITVDERVGSSGSADTVIVVEAKPIFDVPPSGLYYVNVTVTGIPAAPAKTSAM